MERLLSTISNVFSSSGSSKKTSRRESEDEGQVLPQREILIDFPFETVLEAYLSFKSMDGANCNSPEPLVIVNGSQTTYTTRPT